MTPSYPSIELTKIVNFMYQVNFRRIYVELSKPNGASFSLILTLTWRIYGKGLFCLVLSECARQFYKVTNKNFNFCDVTKWVFTVLITCLSVSISTTFLLAIINFHITASSPDWWTQQCLYMYITLTWLVNVVANGNWFSKWTFEFLCFLY